MPVTVQQVPNEPIIIATFTGAISPPLVQEMFARSAALIDEMGIAEVWRVTNVSQIDIDIAVLFSLLAEAAKKNISGSSADPRFHAMLVGSNSLVKLYARAIKDKRYGELSLPVFETVDEALVYARSQIAATDRSSSSDEARSRFAS